MLGCLCYLLLTGMQTDSELLLIFQIIISSNIVSFQFSPYINTVQKWHPVYINIIFLK